MKPIFTSFQKLNIHAFPWLSDTDYCHVTFSRFCQHISKVCILEICVPVSTIQVLSDFIKKDKKLFELLFLPFYSIFIQHFRRCIDCHFFLRTIIVYFFENRNEALWICKSDMRKRQPYIRYYRLSFSPCFICIDDGLLCLVSSFSSKIDITISSSIRRTEFHIFNRWHIFKIRN